jgi:hypothetical protein
MAKLANASDLKSAGAKLLEGSIPSRGTIHMTKDQSVSYFLIIASSLLSHEKREIRDMAIFINFVLTDVEIRELVKGKMLDLNQEGDSNGRF